MPFCDDPASRELGTEQAPGIAGPDACGLGPLDSADAAFRLLTSGPRPLALNPARLAPGLPDRDVPLGELKAVLLHPATPATARNQVWAELVRRAHTGGPAWVIGLTGVAMPGLRRAAATLSAAHRGDPEDLQAEVLTGFLAAVRGLDPGDLEAVPLASRLCWAAWRAGQALAYADASWASRRRDLPEGSGGPVMPWGHPDFVLAAAVRQQVITAAEAQLIGRSRLEGVPMAQMARQLQVSHQALCQRRRRAEARLVRAIRGGELTGPETPDATRVKNTPQTRISVSAGRSRPGTPPGGPGPPPHR